MFDFEEEDFEFDVDAEWQGMPEFVSTGRKCFHKAVVYFETEKNWEDFKKAAQVQNGDNPKTLWFPFAKARKLKNYNYVDKEK